MSEYWEPVLCPVSPEFVKMLKQPGGLEYTGRFRLRLQDDGVIVFEAIHDCIVMDCDTAHIDGQDPPAGQGLPCHGTSPAPPGTTQKCPSCGAENPAHLWMCWSCHTALIDGKASDA